MKNCLLILFLLICKCAFSQLNDGFNDGNFTLQPSWQGDMDAFAVNHGNELQTNRSASGSTSSLVTKNKLSKSVRWEFYVRLDFDPSASNRLRAYLISDSDSLNGPLNGYFIQIGEAGSADSYDLYRQSGTSVTKVLDGPAQARANPDQLVCRLRVTRDDNGEWELAADNTGGSDFKPAGTANDDTYTTTAWFGIACLFTATRSDKFYFDDFAIEEWKSDTPPAREAEANDIVINEILADPDPSVALPAAEFVELWNRTTEDIPLKNWTYSDASTTYRFDAETVKAGEYVILCSKADTGKFRDFARVLGIAPWPALNNNADELTLRHPTGKIISSMGYSAAWYPDGKKRDGGWSLELVDPLSRCTGKQNWLASTDSAGGTPGRTNSVYQLIDQAEPLAISRVVMIDSMTIGVTFNRYTDSLTAADPGNYSLNNGAGKPAQAFYSSADQLTVALKFSLPIGRGKMYKLTVSGVTDCSGSVIRPGKDALDFFVPAKAGEGGILISEVLFNPRSTGVDFVELYNNSGDELDLADLSLSNSTQADTLNGGKQITKSQRLIKPGEFIVLTSDPEKVKSEYFTENRQAFIKMSSFPSFNNEAGVVTILRDKQIIDQFSYSAKMHMPLIKNPDGISLERSSYARPANDPGNFRSAAASVGFATPGYKNSQQLPESDIADEFTIASNTFSPDDDGFEDQMEIHYRLSKPGFVANVTIFNDRGNAIRKLYKNYTLGISGTLSWDGLDETASTRTAGIYLVYAELFNTEGEIKKFRKTVVLAKKLN